MLMIPPALDDEIRRPQDSSRCEQVGDAVLGELVVGRAGDDRTTERGTVSSSRIAAERARREHVDLDRQRGGGRDPAGADRARRSRACPASTSETTSLAPARARRRATRAPTWPSPMHADAPSARATSLPNTRSQQARIAASTPSAVNGRGIAGAAPPAGQPGDVARARGDHTHVAARGTNVLGGDVGAGEQLDRVGEVEQHRSALGRGQRPVRRGA